MGTTMSYFTESNFYIYSRELSSDKYKLLYEIDAQNSNPLSRFKHEIYAYALKKKHIQEKAIYLYCGYSRVAKCIRVVKDEIPYIHVSFTSEESANMYDTCREQLPKIDKQMHWHQQLFSKHWVFQHDDDSTLRIYQNYRMDI